MNVRNGLKISKLSLQIIHIIASKAKNNGIHYFIPGYLDGLICFENPTDEAKQCMDEMTMSITELSTKQITQKLSMDTFFEDFCS